MGTPRDNFCIRDCLLLCHTWDVRKGELGRVSSKLLMALHQAFLFFSLPFFGGLLNDAASCSLLAPPSPPPACFPTFFVCLWVAPHDCPHERAIHGASALRQDLCRLMRQGPTTDNTRLLMWQSTRAISCFLAPCKDLIYIYVCCLLLHLVTSMQVHGNEEERLDWILCVLCPAMYMVHTYTTSRPKQCKQLPDNNLIEYWSAVLVLLAWKVR
jgi:hypothetical protein